MRRLLDHPLAMRFLLYLVLVVMINLVGLQLFKRFDLTAQGMYSLSPASKQAVRQLAEPLTVKAYFSANIPASAAGVRQYLEDLLTEYAVVGGQQFNYQIQVIPAEDTAKARQLRQQARDYGIQPVQLQAVQADEVSFQQVFMGAVLIHGDMVKTLPAITATEDLEYRLTTALRNLNSEVSTWLALDKPVQVSLYQSPQLTRVADVMGLEGLSQLQDKVQQTVQQLSQAHFGKLKFAVRNPIKGDPWQELAQEHGVMQLQWPALPQEQIAGGQGYLGLLVKHGDQARALKVLDVQQTLLGQQYKLRTPEEIKQDLQGVLEQVLQVNRQLGYVTSNGCLPLRAGRGASLQGQSSLRHFKKHIEQNYTLTRVDLSSGIPPGLDGLILAQPSGEFSDWELLQLDQFLLRGGSLAVFSNGLVRQQSQGRPMARPQYAPVDKNLRQLLAHYGVELKPSLLLDENCYKQRLSQAQGGGERPLYMAPRIRQQQIDNSLPFMANIKGLITLQASPLQAVGQQQEVTTHELFRSSPQAWLTKHPGQRNPMLQQPPPDEEQQAYSLAYLLQGRFQSYFAASDLPQPPVAEKQKKSAQPKQAAAGDQQGVSEAAKATQPKKVSLSHSRNFRKQGQNARLLVVGSGQMLQDSLLDAEARSPNATFVLNAVDALNQRPEIAQLRSKNQRFQPLPATSAGVRQMVKAVNVVGVPVLVLAGGLVVWGRRQRRKRWIQQQFRG